MDSAPAHLRRWHRPSGHVEVTPEAEDVELVSRLLGRSIEGSALDLFPLRVFDLLHYLLSNMSLVPVYATAVLGAYPLGLHYHILLARIRGARVIAPSNA